MMNANREINTNAKNNFKKKEDRPIEKNTGQMEKAVDSLTEQKKKLDISMYYTHQDADKAKQMASGTYKDLYVVKAKFSVSTTYGAFLFFFSIPYSSLIHSYAIMSHSYEVDDLKSNTGWRNFEENMISVNEHGGHDNEMTSKMKTELAQAFSTQKGASQRALELKKYLEANDQIAANNIIKKFIQDKFGFININLSIDYEQTSSLDMELSSKTSNKLDKELVSEAEKKKQEKGTESADADEDIDVDKKDIQLILMGNLVLSPIKGKAISSVETGDRIKINLDTSNSKAITVAKAFKAYEEGKIFPIMGRVVSIRHLSKGGYKIFCLIAKGIYVKIEEEEEDIRIASETPGEVREEHSSNTTILIVIVVILFILVVIGLVFIFK
ncbi:MAG: hypothetical protein V1874_07355 [Spirochaetota bacterium]